jgi:hypothetical protein
VYDASGTTTTLPNSGEPKIAPRTVYDDWNRLTDAENSPGVVEKPEYDGKRRQIWCSKDPIASSPNLYEYCGDDPLVETDPSGECGCESTPSWTNAFQLTDTNAEEVPIPKNDQGCTGYCFHLEGSKLLNYNITNIAVKERGGGCPVVLKALIKVLNNRFTRGKKINEFKDMISKSLDVDTCSSGCSCGDKTDYSGKTITITLNQEEIELDPGRFIPPFNNFKKGECNLTVTATLTIQVGKGWIGRCVKD